MENRCYSNEIPKKTGAKVSIAGWVYDVRIKGGINFILLRDRAGIIQIVITKENSSSETIELAKKLHQEDVIRLTGKVEKARSQKLGLKSCPKKSRL